MKKKVFLDRNAKKELDHFSENVKVEFEAYFEILKNEGRLTLPEAKKVTKDLFELRVKIGGEYRGFYAYIGKMYIIILHFFKKTTQKTPIKNIKTAKRRLDKYE